MHEDLSKLLNAYMDGELHGSRLLEMERHLASCQVCRKELDQLRQVSQLLQASPAPHFMPVDNFVSNLNLRLPRREGRDRSPRLTSLAWWLVPAALIVTFFFVRTVLTLNDAVTVAGAAGLLGDAGWLSAGQQASWYGSVMGMFGGSIGDAQSVLSTLNSLSVWGGGLLDGFLWQIGILLLYCAWLVVWWWRHAPRQMKEAAGLPQS